MREQKWYLSSWFIALMFMFWFLVVPLVIGIILLIRQNKEHQMVRKEWEDSGFGDLVRIQERRDKIQKEVQELIGNAEKEAKGIIEGAKTEGDDLRKVAQGIVDNAKKEVVDLKNEISELTKEVHNAEQKKKELHNEIVVLEDEVLYQSFGFYTPKYNLENSEAYKQRLESVRNKQKEMVKNRKATIHSDDWRLDGNKQKGKAMNNNNIKLTIRSFNNECDAAISKVKFNNIQSIEKRIEKAFDALNKVNKHNKIEIKQEYFKLKKEELYLAYEYEKKKEEEREEQRRIKEQMREEQRVLQEINKIKEKLEKEETHFKQEIDKLKKKLETATGSMKELIETKIRELEEKLVLIEKDKEDVYNREQNTRAGYVYIISNIGSFGENVYKIGMTRRLEPTERIRELSGASVPFGFDIHAMIFSEDAPSLENALHKSFRRKSVNKVNHRKEFFYVTLKEIEDIVKKNHNKVVEFTKLAEAQEYRQSVMIDQTQLEVAATR